MGNISLEVLSMLRKSQSIQALGTANLSKAWVPPSLRAGLIHSSLALLVTLRVSPLEAVQLVGLASSALGTKTARTSQEARSQNKIRKLSWPQSVPVPSLHATLPDALVELGMSYSLPSRM